MTADLYRTESTKSIWFQTRRVLEPSFRDVLISHLTISDANHDVESSILTKDQLEVFIFHKGTLEAELVLMNIIWFKIGITVAQN